MAKLMFAFDRSLRRIDADGRLHVAITPISKANICGYRGKEIPNAEALGLEPEKLYQLWRHPEELAKAASTSNNIQLMGGHIIVSAEEPRHLRVVGSTGTDGVFEAPYLKNSLVVWDQEAIDAIQTADQDPADEDGAKELSCAYRYVADMTPGTYQGLRYDGIMREIVFNHVALVPEGRAGPDVVVEDAKPEPVEMAKGKIKSRTALMVQGALTAFLAPRLAADAKVDLATILADVNAKNFRTAKTGIARRLTLATDGKLVTGADLKDLPFALDAMEGCATAKDDDLDAMDSDDDDPEKKAAKDAKKAEDAEEEEAREAAQEAEDARRAKDGEPDETDEDKTKREAKQAGDRKKARDKKRARDAAGGSADPEGPRGEKGGIDQKAMDAALAKTRRDTIAEMQAMDQARRDVEPHVGKLTDQFDTASEIYRFALDSAGVEAADGTPLATLRTMVGMIKPNDGEAAPDFAMDAAGRDDFNKRFPGAARFGADN